MQCTHKTLTKCCCKKRQESIYEKEYYHFERSRFLFCQEGKDGKAEESCCYFSQDLTLKKEVYDCNIESVQFSGLPCTTVATLNIIQHESESWRVEGPSHWIPGEARKAILRHSERQCGCPGSQSGVQGHSPNGVMSLNTILAVEIALFELTSH